VIHVDFDPAKLPAAHQAFWLAWSKSADRATKRALADARAGRPHTFKPRIWGKLKEWLLEHVFCGKCAYCESKVGITGFGAGEHYRPKARVTKKTRSGVIVIVTFRGKRHPGYHWLPYHWQNLLPACDQCNTMGKMNQFPILGKYVTSPRGRGPAEIDAVEKPLLIHPYFDKPEDHLAFGEKGVVASKSLRGETSIDVYNLTRGDLVAARQKEQELAWLKLKSALDGASGAADAVVAPYLSGMEPYSAAVRDYVRMKLRERIAAESTLLGKV
jgi:hypothetical protein